MIERVKRAITEHKVVVLTILLVLIVGVAYAVGRYSASERTTAESPPS